MLKEYLEGIKDLTPEKNELTHRLFLHNLLDSLKDNFNKEFKIEHEPNRDKQGGQPDFRISYQGLNIGYIENKRVGTDLRKIVESEKSKQILKYLELNPNLMLTDYLNFMWVGKDENNAPFIKKEISVASLDELSKPLKPNPQTERDLIELFKSFFNHEAAPIANAKDFATHLSPRTKYLKDALIKYQEKEQVSSIFNNFKEYLYEELSFEDFSDALAQTLTYSLFLAKINHPFEKINLDNVRSSIPKNFAVIREMADFLKKLDEIEEIQWLLNEILSSINHVDMDSILKDLNDDKDPYLHFYETFLSAYDPKMRESKGVYYTPDSVVKFIINALDSLLKTHFKDAPLGLKSAFITNLDLETKPPKIPMSLLISKQLLKIGDFLYSSNKEKICQVLENGQVRDNENYETSIHKMSAKYLNKTNHNGWKFFYAYYQNQFLLLDELRYICQKDS